METAVEEQFRKLTLRLHRLSPPVFTRTLDAIHLATAQHYAATELVGTDAGLRKSALAIALKVFP